VPTLVVTLMFMTSPERSTVADVVVPAVDTYSVRVTAVPLAAFEVAALLVIVQVWSVLVVSVALFSAVVEARVGTIRLPTKPAFDDCPETWRLPRVTETAPTFRTMIVSEQEPATPVVQADPATVEVNVAVSMLMDDWAAWFCAPCCPPVADDVWLRNP